MRREQTMAGLEVRLRPHGSGRFGGAAFLALWLAFWVVGEVLVLGILLRGGWALVTGEPPGPGRAPLELGPALVTGVFLLAWVSFWTLGGLLAGHEFFRLVWSEDRILVRGDSLELRRRVGFLTTRKSLPRERLRGIYRRESGGMVLAETGEGPEELTRNGTAAEQAELVAALTAELRLVPPDKLQAELPATWRVVAAPEGGQVLVKNPDTRRTQARVAWLVALPLAWVALMVLGEARLRPNFWAVALMVATAAGFALWGAARLTWSRDEWRLERGRVIAQRRRGARVTTKAAGATLRLTETTDSDGDACFRLALRTEAGPDLTVASAMHDGLEPRRLGEWMVDQTGVAWDDQTTPEIKARAAAEQAAWEADKGRLVKEWLTGLFRRD